MLDDDVFVTESIHLFFNMIQSYKQLIETKYLDFSGLLFLYKVLQKKNHDLKTHDSYDIFNLYKVI